LSAQSQQTKNVVRRYHDGWSSHRFDEAAALLAEGLQVEVPVNDYPTREAFVQALVAFGGMVERVDLLSELAEDDQAMLLYDMTLTRLGKLRIVEHFTVANGRITRLRQVHDTVAIRAAGLVSPADAAS
jgi:ketosteroid isomerase-like protein